MVGKYDKLEQYLKGSHKKEENLSYKDIEKIIESKLPPSAYNHRPWWANDRHHTQAKSWLSAGWKVSSVELGRFITFKKEEVVKTAGDCELSRKVKNMMAPTKPEKGGRYTHKY